MISELDQKRQNKTLTAFDGDLYNLLILERKIQKSRRLRRQYNGSVLEHELRSTEGSLALLEARLAAIDADDQAEATIHLRRSAEAAIRKRAALERLIREVAMERRYSKVKSVDLRDENGRAELAAYEHSPWLDLVEGPGMDDGAQPPPRRAAQP